MAFWAAVTAAVIAIVLLVGLSALRTDGWRVPAVSAAVSAGLLGALAIATDGGVADLSAGWGVAVLVWSVLVLLAAVRPRPA